MHPLHAATLTTPDLAETKALFAKELGYKSLIDSTIEDEVAELWQAPDLAGSNYSCLQPENGTASGFVRFVETKCDGTTSPFQHLGWCGIEFAAKDTQALCEQFEGGPIKTLMTPMPPYRPMANAGPNGEGLLFNQQNPDNPFRYEVIDPKSFVDQVAMVVLASRDRLISEAFYANLFGAKPGHRAEMPLPFANATRNLPADTKYQTGAMKLGKVPFIEIDQYDDAEDPIYLNSGLKQGISLVSFNVSSFDEMDLPGSATPITPQDAFYAGDQVLCLRGPDGELIELIERSLS